MVLGRELVIFLEFLFLFTEHLFLDTCCYSPKPLEFFVILTMTERLRKFVLQQYEFFDLLVFFVYFFLTRSFYASETQC